MKNYLLFIVALLVVSKYEAVAQTIAVQQLPQANTQPFIGKPLKNLLDAIQQEYKCFVFVQEPPHRLKSISFYYSLSETEDIRVSVRIKNYQHTQPYEKDTPYWYMDKLILENISEVNVSVVPKLDDTFVKNIQVMQRMFRLKLEQPDMFNAYSKLLELKDKDKEAFDAIVATLLDLQKE